MPLSGLGCEAPRARSTSPLLPSLAALIVLGALLGGCAAVPPPVAGTPATPATVMPRSPPNVAAIPDAVPRDEPRSLLGNPPFYEVDGHRYFVLPSAAGYVERGVASWYGPQFHGLRTATGESYDMFAMTAAHKTLPLPCYVRVTNLSNGRSVVVRVNDRGPFVGNRIIDLSYTAAAKLGMLRAGTAFVQIETLLPAGTPPLPPVALPLHTAEGSLASAGLSSVPALSTSQLQALPHGGSGSADAAPMYVQVGAYALAANAERVAEQLRTAGVAQVLVLATSAPAPLSRVRVGPIATVQQFDAVLQRLRELGYPGARLAQD